MTKDAFLHPIRHVPNNIPTTLNRDEDGKRALNFESFIKCTGESFKVSCIGPSESSPDGDHVGGTSLYLELPPRLRGVNAMRRDSSEIR